MLICVATSLQAAEFIQLSCQNVGLSCKNGIGVPMFLSDDGIVMKFSSDNLSNGPHGDYLWV